MNGSLSQVLGDYLLGLQHVGHIVEDLEAAVAEFQRLYGVGDDAVRWEPSKDASLTDAILTRFAFVTVAGTEFELIQPLAEPFVSLLNAKPSGSAGINHVAWRVSDVDAAMEALLRQGIRPGHVTPQGVVQFQHKKLVYLDPATTGGLLVELIEWT